MDPVIIGRNVYRARFAKAMTQRELAEKIGVHFNTICYIESGKHPPSPKTLGLIANALGVSAATLLRGA